MFFPVIKVVKADHVESWKRYQLTIKLSVDSDRVKEIVHPVVMVQDVGKSKVGTEGGSISTTPVIYKTAIEEKSEELPVVSKDLTLR